MCAATIVVDQDCDNCGWICDNCGLFAKVVVGVATIVVDCDNCEHCDNCDHINYVMTQCKNCDDSWLPGAESFPMMYKYE